MADCTWTDATPAPDPWAKLPRALIQEEGGFLEAENCGLMLLEDA